MAARPVSRRVSADPLPTAWLKQFDGNALETKLSVSCILATVAADSWPHLAYLSAGEVLAQGALHVSFCLWPSSRSAGNVVATGRAVLHAAAEGAVWEVRLAARQRDFEGEIAIFDGDVMNVAKHAAPYARVESLIDFRLTVSDAAVSRWKKQIERLRQSDVAK